MADPKKLLNPSNMMFVDTDPTVSQPVPVSDVDPLPVTLVSGSTDQDVNLVGINGAAPVTGSGTATGALRVELPSNGTGVIATVAAVTALTNALPAGNNNIGDVDVASIAAGSNIIGNVRIDQTTPGTTNGVVVNSTTTLTPGTGATNLGKAEDAAHVSGDTGIEILGVRKDTAAAFGADGDYTPIRTDQFGDVASLIVDSTGAPIDYTSAVPVILTSSYPSGATPETATSGIISNASAAATLATTSGKTTYIAGFSATPGAATGAAIVKVVVSGTITGSMTYYVAVTNGTTFVPAPVPLIVPFNPPIPASATNTTIVVTMDAVGTGGATAAVNAWGYLL